MNTKEQKEFRDRMQKVAKLSAIETQRFLDSMCKIADDEGEPMTALMAYSHGMLGTLYTHAYVDSEVEVRDLLDALATMAISVTEDLVKLSHQQKEKSNAAAQTSH